MIWSLLFLASFASAEFTPLPASTPESTNSNFKAIDEEVRRLGTLITEQGATITSSSNVFSGTNTFSGPVTFSSTTTGPYGVMKWVHFVGTGTYAVMAGYDVASVAHNGAANSGNYTVTFNHPWTSADSYMCACSAQLIGTDVWRLCLYETANLPTASAIILRVIRPSNEAQTDADRIRLFCIGY